MTSRGVSETADGADRYVLELPADLRRLRDARQFVYDSIAEWGFAPPDDAGLLTTEVVSNAIIHVGGPVGLRRDGRRALVEVHDDSCEPPQRRLPEPGRAGGRGMHIIEALASDWGVTETHDDGKVVWFKVSLAVAWTISANGQKSSVADGGEPSWTPIGTVHASNGAKFAACGKAAWFAFGDDWNPARVDACLRAFVSPGKARTLPRDAYNEPVPPHPT